MFIGFFGYIPDEFLIGDNVSFLWMTPDKGDGTWSMYGWSNTDLKVVSDYLDNLTGTQNVLSDTGLDIFIGNSGPIISPKAMPFGIAEDDSFAPIMEVMQSPVIASAMIAAGAAGAPNLTEAKNVEPIDGCPPAVSNDDGHITQLDMNLASYARTIQEMMNVWLSDEILDSLAVTGFDRETEALRTCWPCIPTVAWACTAWSLWSCTGGPVLAGGVCSYTGCTRSRTCAVIFTHLNCTTTTLTLNATQGPSAKTAPALPGGGCPVGP